MKQVFGMSSRDQAQIVELESEDRDNLQCAVSEIFEATHDMDAGKSSVGDRNNCTPQPVNVIIAPPQVDVDQSGSRIHSRENAYNEEMRQEQQESILESDPEPDQPQNYSKRSKRR